VRLLNLINESHARNKELLEIVQQYQQKKLDGLHQFLYKFFEDTTVEHHIIHITTGGNLTIKIGQETDMLDVDMKLFLEDPIVALEQIRTQWIADHRDVR
jgi:transcriptional regulator of heat shock response